jgi:hypothetical protein
MSLERARLLADTYEQQEDLQEDMTKKDLWSSVGGAAGALALGLLMPAALPAIAGKLGAGAAAKAAVGAFAKGAIGKGLAAGAGQLLGGAAGSKAAGPIRGGSLISGARQSAKKALDPFGTKNVAGALQTGLTAGLLSGAGQAVSKVKKAGDLTSASSPGAQYISGATPTSVAQGAGVASQPLPLNTGSEVFTGADAGMGISAYDMYQTKGSLLGNIGSGLKSFAGTPNPNMQFNNPFSGLGNWQDALFNK